MEEELILAMENLEEDKVIDLARQLWDRGTSSISIMRVLNSGMIRVGKRFEMGVYYLADLIVSGFIYRRALSLLIPAKSQCLPDEPAGKIVLGVARGDIHDIGKDIVALTFSAEGFEVIDLGINVKREDFIMAVERYRPDILALSGTMTFAVDEMEMIIHDLSDKNLRDGVTVIVGGISANKINARRIGADYYAKDPIEAIAICKGLIKL
jgi:methanogenic corrinoid protein MtbC1